jgi:hypothetical protein
LGREIPAKVQEEKSPKGFKGRNLLKGLREKSPQGFRRRNSLRV